MSERRRQRRRAGVLWTSLALLAACDSAEPTAASVPEPEAPAPAAAAVVEPEAPEGLRVAEQSVYGLVLPSGTTEMEARDGFTRHRFTGSLGDVRAFFRNHLEGFREEHYASAGTSFVATDGSDREVMIIRRPGSDHLEVTYFERGRDAAEIGNREDLAHTQVRPAAEIAEAAARELVEQGGVPEATVRRIGPSQQFDGRNGNPTNGNAAPPSAVAAGRGAGGSLAAGTGQGSVGQQEPLGSTAGFGTDSLQPGAAPATAPTITRRGADSPRQGPRRVGDSPLDFDNPHFERPGNPNALH